MCGYAAIIGTLKCVSYHKYVIISHMRLDRRVESLLLTGMPHTTQSGTSTGDEFMQDVICQNPQCRKTFQVYTFQIKRSIGKFCSRKCSYFSQRIADPIQSTIKRFWGKVHICNHGNDCPYCCWPWHGIIRKNHYGHFAMTLPNVSHN